MTAVSNFYKSAVLALALLFVAVISLHSQTNAVDTFQKFIDKLPNDSLKLAEAGVISKYCENIDSGLAWKYYRVAKKLADKINTPLAKVTILELEGVLNTKDNPAKAYTLYKQAIDLCRTIPPGLVTKKYEASLINNVGVISYLNGDYEGAIQSFIEAVKIYQQYDKANGNLVPTISNIASTYEQLDYPAKSFQYALEAVQYAEKDGAPRQRAVSYINLANSLLTMGKLDSGLHVIRKALDLTKTTGNQYDLILCFNNIGDYFDKKENYDSALVYYGKSLPLTRQINSPYDVSAALNKLAKVEMEKKDFAKAKIYLDSAEVINKQYNFKDIEKAWFMFRSDLLNGMHDPAAALASYKRYKEMEDSLIKETRLKRIDFLDARYESEKKQNAITELEKEQKIQQLSLRQKAILNYILIGSLVVVLIVGFLLYRNYRQKQLLQQQQIKDLEKDKQLLAVDAMLKGQEEERSRLAKDLHDGLGGMLSGVKYSLNNMKENLIVTPDNMAVFERSLDMIDTSISELRRVAHNMMPEMLVKFGLDEALREYTNSITVTKLLNIKYQSFGMKDRLDSSFEIIIYRVVQELINNVLKHAAATEVLVQLVREENRLNVLVEDNGKGFDSSSLEKNRGAGWSNIRSRVDYLKGRIDIHSEAGKGTSVSIEFNV